MKAVFALRADYQDLINRVEKPSEYRLVTENLRIDFCSLDISEVIFLNDFEIAYRNLYRIALELKPYVRGPRCKAAIDKLDTLLNIELEIQNIHRKMLTETFFKPKEQNEYN